MRLAVDPDKHLIKMPAPLRIESMMNTAFPDLGSKQWAKAVPPVPHRFVRDIDASFVEQVLDLSQGEWKSNIQHHREADDLGRAIEITEEIVHRRRLGDLTSRLKPI